MKQQTPTMAADPGAGCEQYRRGRGVRVRRDHGAEVSALAGEARTGQEAVCRSRRADRMCRWRSTTSAKTGASTRAKPMNFCPEQPLAVAEHYASVDGWLTADKQCAK